MTAHFNRRRFLTAAATTLLAGRLPRSARGQSPGFTEWGYPLPYSRVSQASLDWLNKSGWLPLSVGFFADLPGYASSYAVMRELDLLGKRGLPAKFTSFLSGPPILEAFIGGQAQATGYGDLPFWTTIARGNPAVAYAVTAVNYEAAMLVRNDSPLHSISDIKGQPSPIVIGTLLGSFLEFYIGAAAKVAGLEAGRDYTLAGITLREGQFLPKGVDAIVSYDPFVSVTLDKKLGRKIDDAFPYYFNKGYDFVRREIHENAPDVVQALADAMLEATLYTRFDVDKVTKIYHDNPQVIASYPAELFADQIRKYDNLYKPTFRYLHADFWAAQDVILAKAQFEKKRMPRELSISDMKAAFVPQYMERALAMNGFAVPAKPVFLPNDWNGVVGNPPYPKYLNLGTLDKSQEFPEKGDLTKPWSFKGVNYSPS